MDTKAQALLSSARTSRRDVSLFLEDLELARVAFSCHMALDVLCQEMLEAL